MRQFYYLLTMLFMLGVQYPGSAYADPPDDEQGLLIQLSGTSVQGTKITLPDTHHPYTLIVLWATWCPICLSEMPAFNAFYARHQKEGLLLLGLNVDTDPVQLQHYLQQHAVLFPIIQRDKNGERDSLHHLGVTPVNYLVGADGRIRWRRVGPLDDILNQ